MTEKPNRKNFTLYIQVEGDPCAMYFKEADTADGDDDEMENILEYCPENAKMLLRHLISNAGPHSYKTLESSLFLVPASDRKTNQGAATTKNAVHDLRKCLIDTIGIPEEEPGEQDKTGPIHLRKWTLNVASNNRVLMCLHKPRASMIEISFPKLMEHPDVYVDVLAKPKPVAGSNDDVFMAPMIDANDGVKHDDILKSIHQILTDDAHPYVAVRGTGGLGKTHLAIRYAHQYRNDYPGGVFWVTLSHAESVQEAFAALCLNLDIASYLPRADQVRMIKQRLQNKTSACLLVIDGASEAEYDEYLPSIGPCRILMTTRSQDLLTSVFTDVPLPLLDANQGIELLEEICSVSETSRRLSKKYSGVSTLAALSRERKAQSGINSDLYVRLPLTLTLIGHYIRRNASTYEECRTLLQNMSVRVFKGAKIKYSIEQAYDLSRTGLSPAARDVIAAACCFAGPNISLDLLFQASNLEDRLDFDEAIAELVGASLVSRSGTRVTLHEVIRELAFLQSEDPEPILQHVAQTMLRHVKSGNEAMQWDSVHPEIDHCRHIASKCATKPSLYVRSQLLCEIGSYYTFQGDRSSALKALCSEWRANKTNITSDPLLHAEFLKQICFTEPTPELKDKNDAFFGFYTSGRTIKRECRSAARKALLIARTHYGKCNVALVEFYALVGYVLKMQGYPRRALPYYRQALNISEQSRDIEQTAEQSYLVAECLNNLGALHEDRQDLDQALDCLVSAQNMFEEMCRPEHLRRLAITLNNVGRVRTRIGNRRNTAEDANGARAQFQQARKCHWKALKIYQRVFERENKDIAMTLYFMSEALWNLGRGAEALACAERAHTILMREYGDLDPQTKRVGEWLAKLRRNSAG